MYSYNPYYEKYLAHHGVLGMKWGVRRYQNKDGSLTSEGKQRQKELQKKLDDAIAKTPNRSIGWDKDQKKVFKKINKSSSGVFTTHLQWDDILQKYKHTVITKEEKNRIESKINDLNTEYRDKLQKTLKSNGFSENSTSYGGTYYNKNLPKNSKLSVFLFNDKGGPYSSLHPISDSPDAIVNRVLKISKTFEKNFTTINKTAAEYAVKNSLSSYKNEWLRDTKFESMSDKQLSNYLEKQGPNSIDINSRGDGGTIWYQDEKKNDMDFFGDHSVSVEFGVDKNGKIKYNRAGLEG